MAVSDWLTEDEAPPSGAARRSAGPPAPVAVLRGAGEARAAGESERARESASDPASDRRRRLSCRYRREGESRGERWPRTAVT